MLKLMWSVPRIFVVRDTRIDCLIDEARVRVSTVACIIRGWLLGYAV